MPAASGRILQGSIVQQDCYLRGELRENYEKDMRYADDLGL